MHASNVGSIPAAICSIWQHSGGILPVLLALLHGPYWSHHTPSIAARCWLLKGSFGNERNPRRLAAACGREGRVDCKATQTGKGEQTAKTTSKLVGAKKIHEDLLQNILLKT